MIYLKNLLCKDGFSLSYNGSINERKYKEIAIPREIYAF